MRKLTPDHGSNLRDVLHRGQAVEACDERGLQCGRDREWRQRSIELEPIACLAQHAALEDGLGQLLNKQRHTVSPRGDLVKHLSWQSLPTSYCGDQILNVRAIETIEGEGQDVFIIGPGSEELWTCRRKYEQPQFRHQLDDARQQLQGRRVNPM
jgi:hypothetical protein